MGCPQPVQISHSLCRRQLPDVHMVRTTWTRSICQMDTFLPHSYRERFVGTLSFLGVQHLSTSREVNFCFVQNFVKSFCPLEKLKPWLPGENTGTVCHALQGIFQTLRGWTLCLLHLLHWHGFFTTSTTQKPKSHAGLNPIPQLEELVGSALQAFESHWDMLPLALGEVETFCDLGRASQSFITAVTRNG